jgi:hypothetical protein
MNPVYNSLFNKKGVHTGGLCSLYVVPKNWLLNDTNIDFTSGEILTPVTLQAGRNWMVFEIVPANFSFTEIPKDTKSGEYYETTISGSLNNYNQAIQQVVESLRFPEQLVCIVKDRQDRPKLIGNINFGMRLTATHSNTNNPGKETLDLLLTYTSETLAPYYNIGEGDFSITNYEVIFPVTPAGDYLLID